ncbi:uncharacterized protein [Procambarus clarkii]|uniref:uncharacterized protein n=1 Tax=Procambarus clarkii TaxID=6728 RepID=UPI0037436560
MESKRKREYSDCYSVESMSVSSGETSPRVLDNIVTNTTYIASQPNERLISPDSRYSPVNHSTHNGFIQERRRSTRPEETTTTESDAEATAVLTCTIFPKLDRKQVPPAFKTLIPLFTRFLKDTPPTALAEVIPRLKRHLYLKKNNKLSASLVAAAILRFHPDLRERHYTNSVTTPMTLPSIIRDRLSCGLHVPMIHVLYGEALISGCASHLNTRDQQVGAEPYPLSFSTSPPKEFCALIRRVDVMRGMTSHAMALAFRFPSLAASMHGLSHEMWAFMFSKKMPVAAGMELYDAFFIEFERQLAMTIVMPLDKFPPWLTESVISRFKTNTGVAATPSYRPTSEL